MVIQAQLKNRRQSQTQRRDVRRKLRLNVAGKTADGRPGEVLIHDLSTSGMLVQADESVVIGEVIEVELPRTGDHHIEVVWASGTFFGCRFLEPVPPAAVSAALLRSAAERPSQPAVSDESQTSAASFGARLAALRAEQGWAIETLAEQLGVSRQAVWYWETGQAQASARAAGKVPPPVKVPVGFTTFPGEIWAAPRSWVETVYPGLAYFNTVDRGGHFAAWEEPALFASEMRAAFKTLR